MKRRGIEPIAVALAFCASALTAWAGQQSAPRAPFDSHASSEINFSVKGGDEIVEIKNITFEVTGSSIPGRPEGERLALRKTVHSTQVRDNVGVDATASVEAWLLGSSLNAKPLYTVEQTGSEARTVDNALIEFSRGVEEVDWWSVHKLGNGDHLFDTYVPLVRFSISRETLTPRYVGLEVPPDDAEDARLRDPHVVAVVTYASAEKVIREALLTCDDSEQAATMRSYSDETRTVTAVENPASPAKGQGSTATPQSIRINFSPDYPAPSSTVTVAIPLAKDDLDIVHATLPARLHLSVWKR